MSPEELTALTLETWDTKPEHLHAIEAATSGAHGRLSFTVRGWRHNVPSKKQWCCPKCFTWLGQPEPLPKVVASFQTPFVGHARPKHMAEPEAGIGELDEPPVICTKCGAAARQQYLYDVARAIQTPENTADMFARRKATQPTHALHGGGLLEMEHQKHVYFELSEPIDNARALVAKVVALRADQLSMLHDMMHEVPDDEHHRAIDRDDIARMGLDWRMFMRRP